MSTDPRIVAGSDSKASPRRKCACKCSPRCNCHCPCRDHCACEMDCKNECGRKMPRNLVVSIDGTSNQFGKQNTNVVELHSRIITEGASHQLTFYAPGIGTYVPPSYTSLRSWKQRIENYWDLAVAWNFEKTITKAYQWLADNYQPGDRIFLFGFSRGAYQVRTLAGMIEKLGLVNAGNEPLTPFAYELYCNRHKGAVTNNRTEAEQMAERFKNTFARPVKVHFLGAWDTVSSVGIVRGKALPLTDSASHICFFRHALALDERRIKFLPEYVDGGSSTMKMDTVKAAPGEGRLSGAEVPTGSTDGAKKFPIPPSGDRNDGMVTMKNQEDKMEREETGTGPALTSKSKEDGGVGNIKEVWFAGTHSDIGGGIKKNLELNLSGTPLLWMENEATPAELRLRPRDKTGGEWKWEDLQNDTPTKSLHGFWWLLEFLPLKRLTYKGPEATTHCPHFGRGRKIVAHQLIHASVAFKPDHYHPAASWSHAEHPHDWATLVGKDQRNIENISWNKDWQGHLEMDLFDDSYAEDVIVVLRGIISSDDRTGLPRILKRLSFIALSARGAESILNLDANVVEELVKFLSSDQPVLRIASATCLCRLIGGNNNPNNLKLFNFIVEKKVIQSLVHIAECDENEIIRPMHFLNYWLHRYAREATSKQATEVLRDSNVLHRLVMICDSGKYPPVQVEAVSILASLAEDADSVSHILQFPVLRTLSLDMNVKTSTGKDRSPLYMENLIFLRNLARHRDGASSIAVSSRNLVDAAFELLTVDNLGAAATDFLAAMIFHNQTRLIDPTEMVAKLVEGHKNDLRWEVRQKVQEIFAEYASHDDTRPLVTTQDALKTLHQALNDDHSDVRTAGLSFFRKLFESSDMARMLVARRDGLQIVRHALTSRHLDVCVAGLSCFQTLFESDNTRPLVATNDLFQAVLEAITRALETYGKDAALPSFQELVDDDSFRRIVRASSFIRDQVNIRNSASWWSPQLASQNVLVAFAEYRDTVPLLVKAGAIPKALASNDDDVQVAGCVLLQRLARNVEARKSILHNGLVRRLIALYDESAYAHVRAAAKETLQEMLKYYDDVKEWLANQDDSLRAKIAALAEPEEKAEETHDMPWSEARGSPSLRE